MSADDKEMLVRVDERTAELVKLIKGNGRPGLIQRMENMEMWRSMLFGAYLLGAAAVTIYAAVKH